MGRRLSWSVLTRTRLTSDDGIEWRAVCGQNWPVHIISYSSAENQFSVIFPLNVVFLEGSFSTYTNSYLWMDLWTWDTLLTISSILHVPETACHFIPEVKCQPKISPQKWKSDIIQWILNFSWRVIFKITYVSRFSRTTRHNSPIHLTQFPQSDKIPLDFLTKFLQIDCEIRFCQVPL